MFFFPLNEVVLSIRSQNSFLFSFLVKLADGHRFCLLFPDEFHFSTAMFVQNFCTTLQLQTL